MKYRVECMWDDVPREWEPRAAFVERNEADMYCHTRSLNWPERHWRIVDIDTGKCWRHITPKRRER